MLSLIAMAISAIVVNEDFKIYRLVPPAALQDWKLELYELAEAIPSHHHKIQRQFILAADGEVKIAFPNEQIVLQSGQLVQIEPGIVHSIIPIGRAQFFAIDLPGFNYPEDVFEEESLGQEEWKGINSKKLPKVDPKYFGKPCPAGSYLVYNLIGGESTEKKWSVALLEINDSPRHFHKIEKEIFIVVNGVLDIEIDGKQQLFGAGEAITISPGSIHQLKSTGEMPVRVLCFNFPAFDPSDMYTVCDP